MQGHLRCAGFDLLLKEADAELVRRKLPYFSDSEVKVLAYQATAETSGGGKLEKFGLISQSRIEENYLCLVKTVEEWQGSDWRQTVVFVEPDFNIEIACNSNKYSFYLDLGLESSDLHNGRVYEVYGTAWQVSEVEFNDFLLQWSRLIKEF